MYGGVSAVSLSLPSAKLGNVFPGQDHVPLHPLSVFSRFCLLTLSSLIHLEFILVYVVRQGPLCVYFSSIRDPAPPCWTKPLTRPFLPRPEVPLNDTLDCSGSVPAPSPVPFVCVDVDPCGTAFVISVCTAWYRAVLTSCPSETVFLSPVYSFM